jgi:putative restriction endonuclease
MRSLSNLNSAVNYAQIDNELFEFITNEPNLFIEFLIETYFGKHQGKDLQNDYLIDIQKQIISEPANSYSKRIEEIKSKLDSEQFNEEVFVRSDIFKREVPKTYNYACAISGLRIDSLENISMVDACHIIPFAESYNDTISNGIALSPNLHRAFDRGLISIDFQYHVIINENFIEKSGADYVIKLFDGKKINLPSNENYYPSFDSLKYHHEKFSFKI